MPTADVTELSRRDYDLFRRYVYEQSGIELGPQKLHLLRARLGRQIRSGRFRSYREYYESVKADASGQALAELIDAVSTNTTHLFREKRHFEFLARLLEQWADARGPDHRPQVRIWSAGCSSGEEPYSIAMTCADLQARGVRLDVQILATDISTRVLERARAARYARDRLAQLPPGYIQRFLTRTGGPDGPSYRPTEEIRRMVTFDRFNLMTARFPFRHGFDVIFCRNVMIYFDRPTVQQLVARFRGVLRPRGYLLIGHSESLNNLSHELAYIMPTAYQRA